MERVAGSKDVVKPSGAQNPLAALTDLGQSLWIDSLDRRAIVSGELQAHIERDSLPSSTRRSRAASSTISPSSS